MRLFVFSFLFVLHVSGGVWLLYVVCWRVFVI